MPTFDYSCRSCGAQFDAYSTIADRDSGECPDCGSKKVQRLISMPSIRPESLDDFSSENGGKGRYNPQVQKYFRHVNDVKDYARKTGYDYST